MFGVMNEDDGGVDQSDCHLDLMREEKRREEKRREEKRFDASTHKLLTMSRIGSYIRMEAREKGRQKDDQMRCLG